MAGTKAGGKKAYQTRLKKYGADAMSEMGKKGGKASVGNFKRDRELARRAGKISKRGKLNLNKEK